MKEIIVEIKNEQGLHARPAALIANIAKKYNVKLIPLTDIHIGSGKEIEAYEYTIKDGYFYKIDMSEMFDKLNDSEKENFHKILQESNFFNIRSWIYNNYREEWGYIYKERVSSDFEKYYKEKIDDRSQDNSQLSISEFIGYDNKKYIPGSSIKGALRTAFIYSYFLENRKKYQIKKNRNEAQIMEANILNAEKILDYPKPINLLKYLVNSSTYFKKSSVILDFFSGSATTAHSVMQLNAEDGGNRKYIMVQLPELCDEDSEAYKAGYKNICLTNTYIYHKGSVSIKAVSGLQEYLMERNRVVFVKRNSRTRLGYYRFLIYLLLRTTVRFCMGKEKNLKKYRYYFDGVFNRIDKRFPFICFGSK